MPIAHEQATVAEALGIKDGGFWRSFTIDQDGIEGIEGLRSNVRQALKGLAEDEATAPLEGSNSTAWYAVLGYITPPSRSIFNGMSS